MRVERSSSGTSLRCRRQERVLCMEVTVRESDEGANEEVAAGEAPASAAAAALEAGGECHGVASAGTTESSKMSRKEGEGLYTLTRHKNSPALEHDFCPYAKSLNRTVSEARAMSMQQLGLLAREQKDCTRDDDAFAAASEALAAGSAAEPWQKKKLGEDDVAPSIRTGQVDRFVYKSYSSLCDRRTSSLPVGKGHAAARKMCIGEYWEVEGHNKMGTTASSSKSVSMSTTQENDFDMEAERRSKSVLLFQAAHTVLTIAIALLTVYLCICFLTSSVPRLNTATTTTRTRSAIGGGFSHAKLLAMASSPLLGLVSAGLAILTGMWMSDAGVLWRCSDNVVASFCSHCADVGEESRNRVEQADEQVLQTHQAKQQFMAYVFHNIRVPFNAIVLGLGHMRATEDGVGALGLADKMDLVQMMLDCAETMTSVLDNVTDMGQWESGQMELHREEFDILTVVRFLSWGLKDLLEQKQIAFNMNIDDMTSKLLASHHVVGDKQRIVQTLGNFLSNAIKFTPAGGKLDLDLQCEEVTESMELDTLCKSSLPPSYPAPADPAEDSLLGATGSSILAKTAPQRIFTDGKVARIRFSVKDDGIGISADDQMKLFEPYSFVTSGWVQKSGVSGLGLSMAKRYVEGAGGSIGVESAEGKGSTFFFSIPFPLIHCDPSISRKPSQSFSDSNLALLENIELSNSLPSSGVTHDTTANGMLNTGREEPRAGNNGITQKVTDIAKLDGGSFQRKVLLVEDTRINRIILRKVLQNLNLQCDEAENGQIAVDYYKQGRTYDLILMDKEMPVMDGHEATRQLRLMGVKTPIIALTGNALQSDRELFFEAGVDDFQTKPLSRDKLVQLLVRYGVESSCSKLR